MGRGEEVGVCGTRRAAFGNDYKTTTTRTRRPDGPITTETAESHPFIAMFFLLGLIGMVLESFNSPDWYRVLTSAVVSLLVVLVLGAIVFGLIRLVARRLFR